MKRMDFNGFVGNWPFFRVRYNTVEKLAQLHARCGIEGGIVSSLEAIFYQDPYEAELQLAKQLEGTPYLHALTLNPMLPGWEDDLKRAVRDLGIKVVRMLPGFHGYTLQDPVMKTVAARLREYGLMLILTLRMRDERTMWMIQPRNIPLDELTAFLDNNRDIPTLIAHVRAGEVGQLAPQMQERENLFADISGFKDGLYALDKLAMAPETRGHLVYGSGAPLMEMQATTMQIDTARIPEADKAQIFAGEALLNCLR